jgi:Zn-dependent protease with chaperone function
MMASTPTRLLAALFMFCAMPSANSDQSTVRIDSKSPALHFPAGNGTVTIEPAFEDYAFMLYDICDAMKLSSKDDCQIYPMNGDLRGNAIATVVDGNRLIIYDRKLSPLVGVEGATAIIAHELGHHFCGHIGRPGSPKDELEADRFAGAALRKTGISLDQAVKVADIFDRRPSRTHPGKAERIEAITSGWKDPEAARKCR